MCDCHKTYQKNTEELSTDEMLKVIDDFANIGTSAIAFTGGEPLLRQDIHILINHSKNRRLRAYLFTNGFLLNDEKIKLLLASGIDGINLSLDGITADTHDKIRGVKGSYERVIYAIKRISSLREKSKKKVSLTVSCVICKDNIDEIEDLVSFASNLKIDHITFSPLRFEGNYDTLPLKPDTEKARAVIAKLIELRKKTRLIDCSLRYLKLLNYYFANKEHFMKCYAGYASCTVDCYGNIHPCTLYSPKVANVRDISLKDCWVSEKFNKARKAIKTCRCCYRNCWTELSLIF
ncbi:MAG: radical SAM protein, partial [Candidatus Omnitrophica bacterium]|nr:radical SAM protein [Candidatus Omnitrophota bacterium]